MFSNLGALLVLIEYASQFFLFNKFAICFNAYDKHCNKLIFIIIMLKINLLGNDYVLTV